MKKKIVIFLLLILLFTVASCKTEKDATSDQKNGTSEITNNSSNSNSQKEEPEIITCDHCSGSGVKYCSNCDHGKMKCSVCYGTGKELLSRNTCSECKGVGTIGYSTGYIKTCTKCLGLGYIETSRKCRFCSATGGYECRLCEGNYVTRCPQCYGRGFTIK